MTPRERILAIRLRERLQDKPEFAEQMGIETADLNIQDEAGEKTKNGGQKYE